MGTLVAAVVLSGSQACAPRLPGLLPCIILQVNLNFHYFQTIDDTGKVVALRTFDENVSIFSVLPKKRHTMFRKVVLAMPRFTPVVFTV